MNQKFNTRIAPSPTGYFHIGTARTAYHNYLIARATSGKFILRIDDTDLSRNDDAYVQVIFDCMAWLGLDYDAVYFQSKRLDLYQQVANDLIKNGKAYFADGAIFLNVIDNLPSYWTDTISGNIKITDNDINNIKDMVLIKSNGTPAYNFCSIVDDLDMNINWIIRGVDHINNTAKQLAILNALGKDNIKFTHVGLIHGLNGKKISKSDGAKSILHYKNDGYNNKAMLNFMLRLGWSPKDPNFDSKYKIINKDLAIKLILDGNFQASKSKFDQNKLDFYNKIYNKIKNNIF